MKNQYGRQEGSRSIHAWHAMNVSNSDRDTPLISVCLAEQEPSWPPC